ncbi:signal peptidase I [Acetivibrio cellulolyticus]|uniref:signal peptidase I n=1 Tax=Acetivibrio cellulolyticus TaxID=35830 RepID=UPI0001E2E773|nr:signal peptidase I [Acetivibrio cellulolyticus]
MEFNKNPENQDKAYDKELEKKFGVNYENEKPNFTKELLKWLLVIVVSVIIALMLRAFVFEWVIVQGQSMENTLYNHQVLFVDKIGYALGSPKRGDIVIFEVIQGDIGYIPITKNIPLLQSLIPPKNEVDYIKRVIGLPGDKIDIIDDKVYVNGIIQEENYIKGITRKQNFEIPCTVPENKVFVMGDNRENSKDSRQIGFVDIEKIKGKAVFRIRPLKEFGSIYD